MLSLWIAIAALSVLALIFGVLLGYASRRFQVEEDPLAEQIDSLLPQSQCGQCGYPGCRPYAEAVAKGEAAINLCAPGGKPVMQEIATLLAVDPLPVEDDTVTAPERHIVWVDEANCIGCTKCIQACPVDAIIGSTRAVHTVLQDVCTGCDLCIAPCPTDCIHPRPIQTNWNWDLTQVVCSPIPDALRIPVKSVPTTSRLLSLTEENTHG